MACICIISNYLAFTVQPFMSILAVSLLIHKNMNKNNLSSFTAKMNNFAGLIDVVKKFGTAYNPANPNLSMATLENFLTEGRMSIKKVSDAETDYLNATTRRLNLFKGIPRSKASFFLIFLRRKITQRYKWRSSVNCCKYSCHNFISDYVQNNHFRFPFFNSF